jgi:hypothetical protein
VLNVHQDGGGGEVSSGNRINPSADPTNVNSKIMCFAKIDLYPCLMVIAGASSNPRAFIAGRWR